MEIEKSFLEERDYLFWVQIGDYHTRIERHHLDDYLRDKKEGKAKIVESLLNCKRK
jgi:hypothetical protein